MRFRIAHLLVGMVFVAIFAAALATPTSRDYASELLKLGAWLFYAGLAVLATARQGRERLIAIGALIFGLSYLCLSYWMNGSLLTSELLSDIFRNFLAENSRADIRGRYDFRNIGEIGFSFIFAAIGGSLGAYWSRSQPKA